MYDLDESIHAASPAETASQSAQTFPRTPCMQNFTVTQNKKDETPRHIP